MVKDWIKLIIREIIIIIIQEVNIYKKTIINKTNISILVNYELFTSRVCYTRLTIVPFFFATPTKNYTFTKNKVKILRKVQTDSENDSERVWADP